MSENVSFPQPETGESLAEVDPYPGFGSDEDILARINLLDWICEQYVNGNVQAKVGDYILATDGRILGVGEDSEELHNRVVAAEPELLHARLVGYFVPLSEY